MVHPHVLVFPLVRMNLDELRDAARPKLERLKQLRTAIDESGGMITLEPKWAKERLEEKITEIENKIETQALDHKAEGSLIAARSQLLKENEMFIGLEQVNLASSPVSSGVANKDALYTVLNDISKTHNNNNVEFSVENHDQFITYLLHTDSVFTGGIGFDNERFQKLRLLEDYIDSIYKLSDAAEAHKRLEEGEHIGKVILKI